MTLLVRSDADQMFTAMHDQLPNSNFLGFGESVAQSRASQSRSRLFRRSVGDGINLIPALRPNGQGKNSIGLDRS